MQHLFLVGFMGSGKSTLGKKIACKLNHTFLDFDTVIEQAEGTSIAQLFASLGEEEFRKLEQTHLQAISSATPLVIATGGGTPCFFDNMAWMNTQGLTCYLYLNPKTLSQRLVKNKASRPVISKVADADLEDFVSDKLTERANFYREAKVQVNMLLSSESNLLKVIQKLLA